MQEKIISRRDALKLAQLGTLLGTGLCIAESAEAQEGTLQLQPKPLKIGRDSLVQMKENRFTVKLMAQNMVANIQSPEIPRDVLNKIVGDGSVRIHWKLTREAPNGKPETLHSDMLSIKWDKL